MSAVHSAATPRPTVEQPRCAMIRRIDARRRLVEDMQFFAVRTFASGETYVSRIPTDTIAPAYPLGGRERAGVAPCPGAHSDTEAR